MNKLIIELTEQELEDLILIRNYFRFHDKTVFEHFAYNFLDKKIQSANVLPKPGKR
jgi:hypothetical protein